MCVRVTFFRVCQRDLWVEVQSIYNKNYKATVTFEVKTKIT